MAFKASYCGIEGMRRMKRRVLWWALAVLVALAAAGSASAATAYSVTDLGPSTDFAEAINARGDVVGTGGQAFLYSHGVLTFLPTLEGTFSTALGVNDRGDVVGFLNTPLEAHAFLYRAGVIHDLGTLGGGFSIANDVDNAGQVTGVSYDAAFRTLPFLYERGQMRSLGFDGAGNAINNRGQVAGWFYPQPLSSLRSARFSTRAVACRTSAPSPAGGAASPRTSTTPGGPWAGRTAGAASSSTRFSMPAV
jgi:probable HAF family extracellular repeat protein